MELLLMEKTKVTEGWECPTFLNSRKFHFFREGRSLCGKYGIFYALSDKVEGLNAATSPDDCKECRRRVNKEIGRIE